MNSLLDAARVAMEAMDSVITEGLTEFRDQLKDAAETLDKAIEADVKQRDSLLAVVMELITDVERVGLDVLSDDDGPDSWPDIVVTYRNAKAALGVPLIHDAVQQIRVTQLEATLSDHEDTIDLPAGEGGLNSSRLYDVPPEHQGSEDEALDWFHDHVPIGCLEDFEIDCVRHPTEETAVPS